MRRGGAGALQIIPTPVPVAPTPTGVLIARYGAFNALATTMTTTETKLTPTSAAGGNSGVTHSSGDFTLVAAGAYMITFVVNIQLFVLNSDTRFWMKLNGSLFANASAGKFGGAVGDFSPVVINLRQAFNAGAVLSFFGITSIANGAQAAAKPASGSLPALPAWSLTIHGWST